VPDTLSDEAAVIVEPAACAVHAASAVADSEVAIIGAGTLGLCVLAALRYFQQPHLVIIAAKHKEQQALATSLGADMVVEPDMLERAVRRASQSLQVDDQLTGGVDAVVDCVGNDASIAQALRVVAPGGTVHMVGMPGRVAVDLTSLWHREVNLKGAYAYTRDDFVKAFELVEARDLGRLVSAMYPLDRYREAIEHAANAGRRGAVKIAFDMRNEKRR
jgi:threonine dehydrogenase-like Zn-dependent dehydrogenase